MKSFTIKSLILAFAMILGACSPAAPAEPTISSENIQSTAVAAALTIVAQTQAAIPTNTPLPPTETPSPTPIPTDTPVPTATLDPVLLPTATTVASGNTDPCNQLLPNPIDGQPTKIRIFNNTKSTVKVSLYLSKTPFGECGFAYVAPLSKNESVQYTHLVKGYYTMYAWSDDGKINVGPAGVNITGTDQTTFEIRENNIVITGP